MTKQGTALGTELGMMWEHGGVHLPELGRKYSRLASLLHQSAVSDAAAFRRRGEDMVGPRDSWTELRNAFQRILAETSRGLDATGRALVQAAEHYAATDSEAARALQATKDERIGDPDVDQPNPDVPLAPLPGDPHTDTDRPVHGSN